MDLSQLMNQFKGLQENLETRFEKMKKEVESIRVVGQAGIAPGNVKVMVRGNRDCEKISLGDTFDQEPKAIREQLIAAAINDAYQKLEQKIRENMGSLAGGLDFAKNFKFPFGNEGSDSGKKEE